MYSFAFGDVVLVSFPFTDLSATKRRPAVIVSSHYYQQHYPDVLIMAITTNVSGLRRSSDLSILYWSEAGLLKPSNIKPLICTLEPGLILKKLGSLESIDQTHLQESLRKWLG